MNLSLPTLWDELIGSSFIGVFLGVLQEVPPVGHLSGHISTAGSRHSADEVARKAGRKARHV